MLIGLDLDNTLISYETAFPRVAIGMGLLSDGFQGGKTEVRNQLRSSPGGEQLWRDLQAEVYGRSISFAEMTTGALQFLKGCLEQNARVVIVSHKSEYATNDRYGVNLRHAALEWMDDQGLFNCKVTGVSRSSVYFESSREEKVERITRLAPDCFVDDLPEVLLDENFPPGVRPVLYVPGARPELDLEMVSSWEELADELFGH